MVGLKRRHTTYHLVTLYTVQVEDPVNLEAQLEHLPAMSHAKRVSKGTRDSGLNAMETYTSRTCQWDKSSRTCHCSSSTPICCGWEKLSVRHDIGANKLECEAYQVVAAWAVHFDDPVNSEVQVAHVFSGCTKGEKWVSGGGTERAPAGAGAPTKEDVLLVLG